MRFGDDQIIETLITSFVTLIDVGNLINVYMHCNFVRTILETKGQVVVTNRIYECERQRQESDVEEVEGVQGSLSRVRDRWDLQNFGLRP